jgi:hypothetical protein
MLDNGIIFDARIAQKYSLEEAIVIANIYGWLKHNATNNMNYHDGRYWTYNSLTAFAKQFPFWSESKVKRILIDLAGGTDKKDVKPKHEPLIMKQNFNKSPFDRTVWYSFTDKFFMYLKGLGYETYTDFPQKETPFSADDQMDIPPADKQYQQYNNTTNNTNKNFTSTIVDVPQSGGEGKEEEILEAEMIEETSEKGERNKKKAEAKNDKKYTVTHRCRLSFEQQYLQFKGEEYYYAAKDANAVKQLIDKIKTKMSDDLKENEDELVQNFTVFIQAILHSGKVEKWVLDNLSLPVINSKFNEIYAQLKNGTSRQPNNGSDPNCRISRDFIERTMREAGLM